MNNLAIYNIMTAFISCKEKRHPQSVMEELEINYKLAVPQSISDSWWFFNCENLPSETPEFLTIKENINPLDYVGYGVSEQEAKDLNRGEHE